MNKYLLTIGAAALGLTTMNLVADDAAAAKAADVTKTEPKKKIWESSASLGMSLTRGNSETLLLTGNIVTSRKLEKNELSFGADGTYGEDDSSVNAASAHGFAQYNRLFTERLFGYGRFDALNDAIADINYRFSLSPGIGYYFIKNDRCFLSGEFGPGYVWESTSGEVEDPLNPGTTDVVHNEDSYFTLRFAERFEYKLTSAAKIWQSLEFVPEAEDFGNYVVTAELGIETAISKATSLRVFMQDIYRSEPAPGREENDLKLVAAVAYKF
jgi:putative salt-induced outer membrane protein YdiY